LVLFFRPEGQQVKRQTPVVWLKIVGNFRGYLRPVNISVCAGCNFLLCAWKIEEESAGGKWLGKWKGKTFLRVDRYVYGFHGRLVKRSLIRATKIEIKKL